jgi:hypothetical protein
MKFEQLWAAGRVRLADLPSSSWAALANPPLACLPAPIAAQRLERIRAVPFGDVFGVLAVLTLCRADDTLAALELLGVIEDSEQPEATPTAPPALTLDAVPAPPPPAAPPGPPAPPPQTLPDPPVTAISPVTAVPPKAGMRTGSACGSTFQLRGRQQKPQEERTCLECGTPFTARRKNHQCCSTACWNQRHNRRRTEGRAAGRPFKECRHCGTTFQPKLRAAQVFCSAACMRAADFARRGRVPPEARPEVPCVTCGSLFHQGSKPNRSTCSPACRAEQVRRNEDSRKLRERHPPEVAQLVMEFSSPGRWRWLLRQINEKGIEDVARNAGLSIKEVMYICKCIYTEND